MTFKHIVRNMTALFALLCVMMSLTACENNKENNTENAFVFNFDYSQNTIEKGAEYSFGVDEWNMYVATAISDKLIRVVKWKKDTSDDPRYEEVGEIGVFRIDDPKMGFIWMDNERTAFYINLQGNSDRTMLKGDLVPFTAIATNSNKNKGTNCVGDAASFLYEYDKFYSYRAVFLAPTTVKIEVWRTHYGTLWNKTLYAYDILVINTEQTSSDFEWTDNEHTSFSISMMDQENGWKEKKLVYFIIEE